MAHLAAGGNVMVPALSALEELGYSVSSSRDFDGERTFIARREDHTFTAADPVALLGLVKLVEVRGWEWQATDTEIEEKLRQYRLD